MLLEYQERELMRLEKEREVAEIKRQHEREIYLLRRKLHEASARRDSSNDAEAIGAGGPSESRPFDASVTIPSFLMTGNGQESHIDYVINVRTGADGRSWKIKRRFRFTYNNDDSFQLYCIDVCFSPQAISSVARCHVSNLWTCGINHPVSCQTDLGQQVGQCRSGKTLFRNHVTF